MTEASQDAEPDWTVVHGRAAGGRHVRGGLPCQDAVAVRRRPDGLWLAALSDGMGTAAQAESAAAEQVAAALDTMTELFPGETNPPELAAAWSLFARVLTAVRRRVVRLAAERGHPARDYLGTLIALAVRPDWVAAASIGDGFVIARFAGRPEHELILAPQRGEYVNETYSALSDDAYDHLDVVVRDGPLAAVFAASDGLLDHALEDGPAGWKPYSPFFANVVEPQLARPGLAPEAIAAFLSDPRIDLPGRDDDKSLVCFFCDRDRPGEAPP